VYGSWSAWISSSVRCKAPDVPVVSESLHQVPRTQQQLLFLDGKGVGKEAR
jgi:hypothetical protein